MLCGSPSCTDAQHSPLERTGSSGWAHCDKSPQAPVNKTFKLGSQACLSNHVTAHCPYPCWLKQSFKKFPSILERFAQSYKRLIRTSPPELVGTIYVCKPHLILWVSGAQGIGQQYGLKDAHWAPLASVLVLASVTLSGASGADSPVCCPAPGGKYLSIADPNQSFSNTGELLALMMPLPPVPPVYLFCWVISVTWSQTSLTGVEHLSS